MIDIMSVDVTNGPCYTYRSALVPRVYEPTFGGFIDIDIAKTKKISLRSLVCLSNFTSSCSSNHISPFIFLSEILEGFKLLFFFPMFNFVVGC